MEKKDNILDVNKMAILDFKIIKGAINSPFEFNALEIIEHKFNVNFDMGFNLEDNLLKADFDFDVTTHSKIEQEEAEGHFSFVFVFGIDNLKKLVTIKEPDKELPIVDANLANAIASISYSTARGILLTRFQGTALNTFMLPIINPNDLLKK
tara:strand:- start:4659 stop:5114 length:456 start_codon:yes stop_codon:yes gene_type:complete